MSLLLPEYGIPPVSEVALSVSFRPLNNWLSPYAGLYWNRIKKEYPRTEVHPPLPSEIENLTDDVPQRPTVRIEFQNPSSSRSWFVADPATRLIQIQRDRFILNWRKIRGDEVYPRYANDIRPRFEREWARFKEFLTEQQFGVPDVQNCEITYVNDLPRGQGWEKFSDALELFANWTSHGSDGFLPMPETLSMMGSFRMPESRGRLRFAMQHVVRQVDQKEVVQLQLSARGAPSSTSDAGVLDWMDIGHEWIVRGFTDLTSPKAHDLWGRTR